MINKGRTKIQMNEVLKKLKLTIQNPVLIMNAPEEYTEIMKDIEGEIHTEIKGKYKFIQIFARSIDEANKYIKDAIEALDGYVIQKELLRNINLT